MRLLTVMTLLFALLLAVCLWTVGYVSRGAQQFDSRFDRLELALEQEDWTAARSGFRQCREQWEPTARRWKLIINHDDMRDIEISFVDLDTALAQEDMHDAVKELAQLRYYLRHVPENERISIDNIL